MNAFWKKSACASLFDTLFRTPGRLEPKWIVAAEEAGHLQPSKMQAAQQPYSRWTNYSNPGQLYPPRPPNFKVVFFFQGLRRVDKTNQTPQHDTSRTRSLTLTFGEGGVVQSFPRGLIKLNLSQSLQIFAELMSDQELRDGVVDLPLWKAFGKVPPTAVAERDSQGITGHCPIASKSG